MRNAIVFLSCAVCLVGIPATAGAEGGAPIEGCVVSGALSARLARARAQAPPISEAEARQLVDALRPTPPGTEVRIARALAEETGLSLERMRILLADVVDLLAHLQAKETLARLDRLQGLEGDVRSFVVAGLETMRDCAPRRFEARGGERSFERALAVVVRYRAEFEPLVADALSWRPERLAVPSAGRDEP